METSAENDRTEMNFLGHIQELRSRLLRSVIGIIVACLLAAFFIEDIMNRFFLRHAIENNITLQNLEPFGQPFLYFKIIFLSGIILAFPYILFQLWGFIAPGLYSTERRWARWIAFFTALCFFVGVAFAYFLLLPSMMGYINTFANQHIENNIATSYYFSFFVNILLASGLMFELPMATFVLSKAGILAPSTLRKFRRHSIVAVLVVAAIITPTPDPITQLMFAIPLYLLFELSIVVSSFAYTAKATTPSA